MIKKIPINKMMYDVLTEQEYRRKFDLNPDATRDLESEYAIQKGEYVYPVQNPMINYSTPGVKNYGIVHKYSHPQTEKEKQEYSVNNIIDFNNVQNCADMIEKAAELAAAERTILTTKDNVTQFVVKDEDTPEFKLLKEAFNHKAIDISSYRQRYQNNFSNDLRILVQGNSITFGKLKSIANASDMEVELIIRDKPGCVNPMGTELRTILT